MIHPIDHGFAGRPPDMQPSNLPPSTTPVEREIAELLRRIASDTADIKRLLADIAMGFN